MLVLNSSPKWLYFNILFGCMDKIKICLLKQKQKTKTTLKIIYLALGEKKKEKKKIWDLLGHKEHQHAKDIY